MKRAWLKTHRVAGEDRVFVAVEDGVVHHIVDDGSDGIFVLACNTDRGAIPTLNQ